MSKNNMARRRDERREEAIARQKVCDNRTPEQQLTNLDKRLGKNKGAKKERKRLTKEMSDK